VNRLWRLSVGVLAFLGALLVVDALSEFIEDGRGGERRVPGRSATSPTT
jgi:hypothetical protein